MTIACRHVGIWDQLVSEFMNSEIRITSLLTGCQNFISKNLHCNVRQSVRLSAPLFNYLSVSDNKEWSPFLYSFIFNYFILMCTPSNFRGS